MIALKDLCQKASSNIAQKDLEGHTGEYPIYGASGLIGYVDFYKQEKPYVAVVKDGAGIGRVMSLPAKSSVIGTMQYILPNDGVDVQYLAFVMENMNLAKYCSGATIPHIYFKDYCAEKLQKHSIKEQKQIAEVLSKVAMLISLRKQQLVKLDELAKSRFVEMFGEPVTNSKGYPIHQLSEHILFLTSGSRGWAQYYTDKGEWFITIKNVKDCRVDVDDVQCITPPQNAEAERTRLREGDLLISITADLGRTGVVTKEIAEHGAYNNQHLTSIRLDQSVLDPLYVAFFMESEAGKRQFEAKNMSAVKAGLNFDSIRSLKLIVPPLALQKEFTAFVAQIDKSKLAVQKSLNELETLKKALMQEYFG